MHWTLPESVLDLVQVKPRLNDGLALMILVTSALVETSKSTPNAAVSESDQPVFSVHGFLLSPQYRQS